MDGSTSALTQSNNLRQVQDYYGAYKSYDVIVKQGPTAGVNIMYLVVNYEKGPLFAKFLAFKSEQGWVITSFIFNTKDEVVFPAGLLK